nr:DUF1186 domain-containing protein [Bradyrhizobium sp. 157]
MRRCSSVSCRWESILSAASAARWSARLGPIEEHLHAVATESELPDFAVGMCVVRIEESAPSLRAVLLRAADGEVLSDDDSLLLFRGLHILGGARDREACQPLLRLLRRPFQDVDDLIGDIVIESLANIVTGVFDDDTTPCSP